jgi:acyl phosphate:glycerol-3-phosphate acyltransferase
MLIYVAIILATYLLGSLSSAVIVSKFFGLPDPRSKGSKNPGATNVLRLGGKLPAILTMLGDGCKGFLPTFLVSYFDLPSLVIATVMLAALLGHIYPIFFNFKGGKGVATAMGAFLGLSWSLGFILIGIWGGVILLTRVSSLGAIIASFMAPIVTWIVVHDIILTLSATIITIILLLRHKDNIARLLKGSEVKI